MVFRNLWRIPYMWFILCHTASHKDKYAKEKIFNNLRYIVRAANWGGNVKIKTTGLENIPAEDGFIFYPNHQGMYDVLAILDACPSYFSVVPKKELMTVPFLKQVFQCMGSIPIDREDIRQSMKVIKDMSESVKKGNNYLIFAEGTRSKKGNEMIEMKAGSFKAATMSKCPIVPVALVDSFVPFDRNTIRKVTVQVNFLKPINYEEYQGMKTNEIAEIVQGRIENAIREATDSDLV
jgi:1-acyl-sn-glycerol-3-phosphate acyltransferase